MSVLDAVETLLENRDPIFRCQAHLTLGRRAIARDDVRTAVAHFQEALILDPEGEAPKTLLRQLGQQVPGERADNRGIFGRWFRSA